MERLPTGCVALDAALAGGLPAGAAVLVTGEDGAGATEFAMTVLRAVARSRKDAVARFASASRRPERASREAETLFESAADAALLDWVPIDPTQAARSCLQALRGPRPPKALVLESARRLAEAEGPGGFLRLWSALAEEAHASGCLVILLHAPGTLAPDVEAALREDADAVLHFSWHEGGASRRRVLVLRKLRGLAPALSGEHVPVFEVSLEPGIGYGLSRARSVL